MSYLASYIQPYVNNIPSLREYVVRQYIYAYVKAYDSTIHYIYKKVGDRKYLSVEVSKYPLLLQYFILYLVERCVDMVDPTQDKGIEQLFNTSVLGTRADFVRWVESGYETYRSSGNYTRRIQIWREIVWSDPVLYEKTMQDRFIYADSTDTVPYWLVWNYGSAYIYGRKGYPPTEPLFFIEKGLQELRSRKEKLRDLIPRSILYYLDAARPPPFHTRLLYIHWPSVYIPLAQKLNVSVVL